MELPVHIGFIVAGILFLLGLLGVMIRRNIIFMLLSIEIMMNAAALAFIIAGAYHHNVDGQVMVLFIYAVAAAEVAVGLALILQMYRQYKTLDVNKLNELRDEKEPLKPTTNPTHR